MKRVAILGSTGSIGRQTIEVIREHPDFFQAEVLTANNNVELLITQAKDLLPNAVVINNKSKYHILVNALKEYPIKVYAGRDAINQIVQNAAIDIVLSALVGFAGLIPTVYAIKSKKNVALANKETLVVAGELISQLVQQNHVNIIPVDSEHSAIFQCLAGEFHNPIEKILLTASGGPFRNYTIDNLKKVTKTDALKHPNWNMGNKVTIDSATLMNKGLEVIEAKWLFDLMPEQIEVIIHPQSIIHSMVQFEDGSIKAQMGLPNMKVPILYALSYPNRIKSDIERFDFKSYPTLSFESPDTGKFRCLTLAYEALKIGGNIPCALNAANEIAVDAFLADQITFLQISSIIENTIKKIPYLHAPDLDGYIHTDMEARKIAKSLI